MKAWHLRHREERKRIWNRMDKTACAIAASKEIKGLRTILKNRIDDHLDKLTELVPPYLDGFATLQWHIERERAKIEAVVETRLKRLEAVLLYLDDRSRV